MPVQFIIVRYPTPREVFVDGEHAGPTEEILQVGEGTHTINLGEPRDYRPKWRRPTVTGTNPLEPHEVTFEPT